MRSYDNSSTIPRIGGGVPEYVATSTAGDLRLSTWQEEHWLILLFYPAAFTPVAVTEFRELAAQKAELKAKNTKIQAISPDSLSSLLAWQRDLKARFQTELDFPLVSDAGLEICHQFGAIHSNASARAPVRATFIVDPKRTIRYLSFYPLANGRSIKEVLRVLDALQASDKHQKTTPAEWQKGQEMLAAPPMTWEDLKEVDKEGCDFYYQPEKVGD